jgi:hypothetical protein
VLDRTKQKEPNSSGLQGSNRTEMLVPRNHSAAKKEEEIILIAA